MANRFTVIHSFQGRDGSGPAARLFRVGQQTLYGTTTQGGTGNCFAGCGVVFKINNLGRLVVLHNFAGGTDGSGPQAGVVRDSQGNLYGTTSSGGDPTCTCGIIFKLDKYGNETVLHRFTGGNDGVSPLGDLVLDKVGNLYGTTAAGGSTNGGTIFKVDAAGNETVLHSLTADEGINPQAGLVRDVEGNLYGTTWQGGLSTGTIFRLDPAGQLTVLHDFVLDGTGPQALTRDANGNLFGTTVQGGTGSYGLVFKLDPAGNYTVLYNFSGRHGINPEGGVVLDSAGNLYGVTLGGGNAACGTIFKVDTSGIEKVLYSFQCSEDGGLPRGGIIINKLGHLFGTTTIFGGAGTIFRLIP